MAIKHLPPPSAHWSSSTIHEATLTFFAFPAAENGNEDSCNYRALRK